MPPLPISENKLEQFIDELSHLPSYSIGRTADNQLVISDSKISGHHARLIYCTPSNFILEDLQSKNGSYVNGLRVTRKVVGEQDLIRLAETEMTCQQLVALLPDKAARPLAKAQPQPVVAPEAPPSPAKSTVAVQPLDFTSSFAALKLVYEQYPRLRRDCRNREKMIRTGSVILSSVVGITAVLSTGGGALPFIQIMSGAGLSVLIPTLSSTLLSTDEKLEIIDREYRDVYRCPNPACRDPFGTRDWDLLAAQKTCRRCQAIWVS
ncbi:FHA domain-containing protein [Spirosoma linguale]|uniref:FHA domain containing protein n=1 Tax=Spirosoma linguale (strain ATCC 33905 / DSM 74 / LMG 10896 / Claus 1) TaxID=504472 RepID=D2QKF9_SPILD|nr:FHA domain containing protein [Spirosoma linguale DSM 74]